MTDSAERLLVPARPEAAPTKQMLLTLGGARAIASFTTFVVHWEYFLPQSWSASIDNLDGNIVYLFMLSGFVLTWSTRSTDSNRRFIRRRFARLWPVYALTWLVGVAISFKENSPHGPKTLFLTFFLLQSWFWKGQVYYKINLVAWSMSCTAFFLLCYLLLRPLLDRSGPRAALLTAVGGVVVSTVVIPLAGTAIPDPAVRRWFLFIFPATRAVEFVTGMFLARFVMTGGRVRLPLTLCGGLVALGVGLNFALPSNFHYVATEALPIAVLLVAGASADLEGRRVWLGARFLVKAGAWSYAFYLSHTLWIRAILLVLPAGHRSPLEIVSLIVASFVLAAAGTVAIFRYVEVPLEKRLRGGRLSQVVAVG